MTTREKFDEKIFCESCKKKTNKGVILKYEESGNEEMGWSDNYYIVTCLGCDTVGFVRKYGDESMIGYDEYGRQMFVEDIYVYPEEPLKNANSKVAEHITKDYVKVPELINMLYIQVVSSVNFRHYLLCAVGLRMIVEGVCKELGITEGPIYNKDGQKVLNADKSEKKNSNLVAKINGLYENGTIVKKQSEILHQIRELGNVSVHELEVPKRSTIIAGIEVIENMLHNIFELERIRISYQTN